MGAESTPPVCKIPGCGRPVRARERCSRCYGRLIRYEREGREVVDPDYSKPKPPPETLVQLTISVPVAVRDWLMAQDDEGRASVSAREVLTKHFHNEMA